MTSTATHEPFHTPVWGTGPGRAGGEWIGGALERLPFGGKPLWIAVMVLAFMAWWPLGLAVLLFLIGSGRMGCRGYRSRTWAERNGRTSGPGWSGPWSAWWGFCGEESAAPSSGNRAFDQYRADTLRRLEEEQREFAAFLDRLRIAKDKAEFDEFMNQRRQRPEPPADTPSSG